MMSNWSNSALKLQAFTGQTRGKIVLVPRIEIISMDRNLPFTLIKIISRT